jgi:hypothetical protein
MVEIIFRLCQWKKVLDDNKTLEIIFKNSSIEKLEALIIQFKKIQPNNSFLSDIRLFVNFFNQELDNTNNRTVFTLTTPNITIGEKNFTVKKDENNFWIDFGKQSLSFFLPISNENNEIEFEITDLRYETIRTLRLAHKTFQLLLQLSDKISNFENYDCDNENHFITFEMTKESKKKKKN